MTGKRLLKQLLKSYEFDDYRPSNWNKKQNNITKRWSKKVRAYIKKELYNDK